MVPVEWRNDETTTTTSSNISKIDLITNENRFLFTSDPNLCCSLNKVDPIDRICEQYDIWVTGVRKDQSKVRQNFEMIAKGKGDIIRFHPMLNWDTKMINTYINMSGTSCNNVWKVY